MDYALYEGEQFSMKEIGFNGESKFINATWFDFLEQYIVPFVEERIIYNAVVEAIDYSDAAIPVKTQNG